MRTFIAINLPDTLKESIGESIRQYKSFGVYVKWVHSKKIHITLKFLGEIDENKIVEIEDAIQKVASQYRPFQLSVEGWGGFPNLHKPRVFWTGIQQGKEHLITIAKDLETYLEPLGFEREKRSFSPHITIGRVKSLSGIHKLTETMEKQQFQKTAFEVKQIEFIKSELTPRGPVYTSIKTCNIGE